MHEFVLPSFVRELGLRKEFGPKFASFVTTDNAGRQRKIDIRGKKLFAAEADGAEQGNHITFGFLDESGQAVGSIDGRLYESQHGKRIDSAFKHILAGSDFPYNLFTDGIKALVLPQQGRKPLLAEWRTVPIMQIVSDNNEGMIRAYLELMRELPGVVHISKMDGQYYGRITIAAPHS